MSRTVTSVTDFANGAAVEHREVTPKFAPAMKMLALWHGYPEPR